MMIEQRAVVVRDAGPDDAEALAAVRRDAWRGAYRGLIDGLTLERMAADRPAAWWRAVASARSALLRVVTLDGRPFGYALAGPVRDRALAPAGEIAELYLDPAHQGLGFGATLFADVRARLAARRMRNLVVWSLTANAAAHRFYAGRGGRVLGERTGRFHGARLRLTGFEWR
jgi:GNAT superfamily N-acetyltransferase